MPDEQGDFWETLATTGRRGVILLAHFVLAVLFIVLLAGVERVFTFFGDPLVVPPSLVTPNWLFRLSDLFHLMDMGVFIVFMWKGIAEMFRDF